MLSLSIWPEICTDATCVLSGMLPDSSTVAPYSLMARANDSAVPGGDGRARGWAARCAGTTAKRLAPSDAAASSISWSSSISTGCTGADHERQGDEQQREEHRRSAV